MEKEKKVLFAYTKAKDFHKVIYMIFGKFEKKKMEKGLDFYYPEFYDVTVLTGNLSSGSSANRKVSCNTPIQISNADEAKSACAGYTQGNPEYRFIKIDNDLKEILNTISKKRINFIYELPINVLTSNMDIVELLLVTNKHAVYFFNNEYLVMDIRSHQILKNSTAACFSVDKAVEGIKAGDEKVYWVRPYCECILEFPRGQKLLMAYHYTGANGEKVYCAFYGEFTKQSRKSTNWSNSREIFWQSPKFDESSLIRIENGYASVEGASYNILCIKRAFSGYTKKSNFYKFEYVCDELKELANNITAKTLYLDGRRLSKYVLNEDLTLLQLTYADEYFIHYENDYDIEVFDTVKGDQMFSEEFNYEEACLSGSNPIQHNGELLYEIDTNTRLQLAIARKNHRHQGERGEEDKAEDSMRAEAVITQYFANDMCLDEADRTEYLLNDLPF